MSQTSAINHLDQKVGCTDCDPSINQYLSEVWVKVGAAIVALAHCAFFLFVKVNISCVMKTSEIYR